MPFAIDKIAPNAKGGTELVKERLRKSIDPALLDKFQIYLSRVHEPLSEDHYRILWLQDLAGDPESEHLKNGGWKKFHQIVCASYWQMRGYMERYSIPYSHICVIRNGIYPIDFNEQKLISPTIRLIYTPTPHRGLQILYPVFDQLSKEFDDIELDVYSSFKLYGWGERDAAFQELFQKLKDHPKINYHGTAPNEDVREALRHAHIFAYPSIWQETSCMSLMEAMSAGLVCVHSDYGALPETAANLTTMYHYNENPHVHAQLFYDILKMVITDLKTKSQDEFNAIMKPQKIFTDMFYGWHNVSRIWENLLTSLANSGIPTELPEKTNEVFSYNK